MHQFPIFARTNLCVQLSQFVDLVLNRCSTDRNATKVRMHLCSYAQKPQKDFQAEKKSAHWQNVKGDPQDGKKPQCKDILYLLSYQKHPETSTGPCPLACQRNEGLTISGAMMGPNGPEQAELEESQRTRMVVKEAGAVVQEWAQKLWHFVAACTHRAMKPQFFQCPHLVWWLFDAFAWYIFLMAGENFLLADIFNVLFHKPTRRSQHTHRHEESQRLRCCAGDLRFGWFAERVSTASNKSLPCFQLRDMVCSRVLAGLGRAPFPGHRLVVHLDLLDSSGELRCGKPGSPGLWGQAAWLFGRRPCPLGPFWYPLALCLFYCLATSEPTLD